MEIDSNVAERAIRPIALNRKNALFAGSDGGGEHWATIASLIETANLNGVDPYAYLADVITRIVAGHPQSQIDDLLPWAYAPAQLKAVAWEQRLLIKSGHCDPAFTGARYCLSASFNRCYEPGDVADIVTLSGNARWRSRSVRLASIKARSGAAANRLG